MGLTFVHLRSTRELSALLMVVFLCDVTGGQNRPPVCNQTYISRSLLEGVPAGTIVLDFKDFCYDPERGPLFYQLNDNANQQFIVPATTDLLRTNKPADAEAFLSYAPKYLASPWTLRVTIKDNANAAHIVTVLVNIISINDNPATMKKLVIPDLREDIVVGTIVGGCDLVDGDFPGSGHDIPLVEIIGGNEDNKFAVDFKTCDVRLLGSLDYETKKSYTLTFRAYNLPNDTNATTKKVTVKVLDVNDNAPMCSSYNIIMDITEDKVANAVLLKLNCSDLDSLNNGRVEFFGFPRDPGIPLKVNKTSGEIILTSDLDFDGDPTKRGMEILVVVKDNGKPQMSTTVTLDLRLVDVDDQPPRFTQYIFEANLPETADIGQLVVTASATDSDSPNTPLSRITYGFETQCTENWLRIDNYTGAILVSNFLDWETAPVVYCTVYAYSSDKFKDRSFCQVTMTINDVNDRSPSFSKILFEGTVLENSPPFTPVLVINASDPDSGISGQITFSFPFASPFDVEPDTGVVYVSANGSVDFETDMTHVLLALATDHGTPSLSSQTYVSITVEPVNEFAPDLMNLTDVYVSELITPGDVLTQVIATDYDAGNDGEIEYYLEDSNVPFLLEKDTGVLRVGVGLDYETTQSYILSVKASDKSKTFVKSSMRDLKVVIVNENENDPVCDTVEPIIITPNNSDYPLCQLNCTDSDMDTVLRYNILRGDMYNIFQIISSNGTLLLTSAPKEGSYIIVIGVSDQATPVKITEVSVQINVETVLTFTKLPASIFVSENTSISSIIFTAGTKGAYKVPTYTIVSQNDQSVIHLTKTTGDLILIGRLDREKTNTFVLTIKATTINGQSAEEELTIHVEDSNDNVPVYSNSIDCIKVSEALPVPSVLSQYRATDQDIDENAHLDYSIVSGDPGNMFRYDSTGDLYLISPLDYETNSLITLVLGVSDRGVPSLSSTMIVNVEVVNVDNENVVIVQSGGTVSVTLPEDTAIGAAVAKINVQNNGNRTDLTFTIISGNPGNNFTIDEKTGVLYLIYSLDRETDETMTIGIRVSSINGKQNETLLVVSITDVNDCFPDINPQNFVFFAQHGTKPGSSLGTVPATDADKGANTDLTLSIISGDPNGRFIFIGNALIAASVLDANVQKIYNLIITAADHGKPSLNTTAYITVIVEPEYKSPYFIPTRYAITLEETRTPGSLIFDCDATFNGSTERSSTNPGDLVYFVSCGDRSKFFVDADTGELQLIGPLNYSTDTTYTLTIKASNKYNLSISDNFTLTINVSQVNRHCPVFYPDLIIWSVSEAAAVGTIVGRLSATDKDPGQYGRLSYSLEANSKFKVNPITGEVSLTSPLEYSTDKSFSLAATVTDDGGLNSKTDSILVTLYVLDANNYRPSFSNRSSIVVVPEDMPMSIVFTNVAATDLDPGTNGNVLYRIVSGNTNGIFILNLTSGDLSLNYSLDYESSPQHILVIKAEDCGTPPLSDTATVTISVSDQNDNPPDFGTTRIEIAVKRNTPSMTSVLKVLASDMDKGQNGAVSYIIRGDSNDLFGINTVSGVIRTTRSLVTADSFYTLIVIGIDHGPLPLTGTVTIGIAVTPTENPGIGHFDFSVNENERVGTLVGSIPSDPALNGIKEYTFIGGNYDNSFLISTNANTEGVLQTNKVLDREAYAFYLLQVSVKYDTGIKVIFVTIKIIDENDNAPECDKSMLETQIVENLGIRYKVGALTCTDVDEKGVNSMLDYYISPPDSIGSTYFAVEDSGLIYLIKPVDYEKISLVKFYVVVEDRGVPQRFTTVTVIVNVVDVTDDNPYIPSNTTYYISREFADDTTEGEVCKLLAEHVGINPAPNDAVNFITTTGSVFYVHPSSGVLSVHRPSLIFGSTRYFQWIIVTVTSAGSTTSRPLLIRLDTFNKGKHVVSVNVDIDLDSLKSNIDVLRSQLQSFFTPPQVVHIWRTQSATQQGRRKLLATSGSEALFVVVTDEAADDMSNLLTEKTFMANSDAVKALQSLPDGTPAQSLVASAPYVMSVLPYTRTDTNGLDPAYIALIVMGCITGLVLVIGVIALKLYCHFHRRFNKDDDNKELVRQNSSETRKNSFETTENSVSLPSDVDSNQTSFDSSFCNTSRETSITDGEGASSANVSDGQSVSRSQSITGRDASSHKRKITPVNEPATEQSGSSNLRSEPDVTSVLDALQSDGTFKATSIIVSTLDLPHRQPETLSSRNSSTMLTSLEDDASDFSRDTSVA